VTQRVVHTKITARTRWFMHSISMLMFGQTRHATIVRVTAGLVQGLTHCSTGLQHLGIYIYRDLLPLVAPTTRSILHPQPT
jgi:hypothetical protein